MTYLNDIDTNKVEELLKDTQENSDYFQSITNDVVNAYVEDLDNIMKNIYVDVVQVNNPPVEMLEKYFLELSNCLYFMGEKLEKLGIYDALSKSASQEVYNKAYLENQTTLSGGKKPTVAENQAVAESKSIYESTVNNVYNKAYKIVKMKIDSAQTMVSTLSKTISRRMSEVTLTNVVGNKQILNENVPF